MENAREVLHAGTEANTWDESTAQTETAKPRQLEVHQGYSRETDHSPQTHKYNQNHQS